jgi:hypothetical protein
MARRDHDEEKEDEDFRDKENRKKGQEYLGIGGPELHGASTSM